MLQALLRCDGLSLALVAGWHGMYGATSALYNASPALSMWRDARRMMEYLEGYITEGARSWRREDQLATADARLGGGEANDNRAGAVHSGESKDS